MIKIETVSNNFTSSYQELSESYDKSRQNFKQSTQKIMNGVKPETIILPDFTHEEIRKSAEEAFLQFGKPTQNTSSIKSFEGAEHWCVTTQKISDVLFKKPTDYLANEKYGFIYAEKNAKARKICEDNNLFLLYVPNCKPFDSNTQIIVEEKLKLLGEGDWYSQKACYRWAIYDPELQSYIKEVFKQLTIFICLFGYCDVKYNNIPFTLDGHIALFDVDEEGSVRGLTSGFCKNKKKKCGLFNLVPLTWFDELLKIAEEKLNKQDFVKLMQNIPQLRENAEKRSLRIESLQTFYKKRNIDIPNKQFIINSEDISNCTPEIKIFIKVLSEHINKEIEHLSLISLAAGRKITIKTRRSDFVRELRKSLDASNFSEVYLEDVREIGLQTLKDCGYVFSYNLDPYHQFISLIC